MFGWMRIRGRSKFVQSQMTICFNTAGEGCAVCGFSLARMSDAPNIASATTAAKRATLLSMVPSTEERMTHASRAAHRLWGGPDLRPYFSCFFPREFLGVISWGGGEPKYAVRI